MELTSHSLSASSYGSNRTSHFWSKDIIDAAGLGECDIYNQVDLQCRWEMKMTHIMQSLLDLEQANPMNGLWALVAVTTWLITRHVDWLHMMIWECASFTCAWTPGFLPNTFMSGQVIFDNLQPIGLLFDSLLPVVHCWYKDDTFE